MYEIRLGDMNKDAVKRWPGEKMNEKLGGLSYCPQLSYLFWFFLQTICHFLIWEQIWEELWLLFSMREIV